MVKLKGIDVAIISQFDIHKLPEYRFDAMSSPELQPLYPKSGGCRSKAPTTALASCYVPFLAGSQIWFEYSIDGPHADEAAYFFKLTVNGKIVTSWDCTAQHGFHGKTVYNLALEGFDEDTGIPMIKRQALTFNAASSDEPSTNLMEDYIEIRVYRIEHRQRLELGTVPKSAIRGNNHGIAETGTLRYDLSIVVVMELN